MEERHVLDMLRISNMVRKLLSIQVRNYECLAQGSGHEDGDFPQINMGSGRKEEYSIYNDTRVLD